jgi:hypothetical protein
MMRDLRKWLLLLLLPSYSLTHAQLTVLDGTSLTVQPDTRLALQQNLTIQTGATFENFGSFFFKGNLINNGFLGSDAGAKFIANGQSLQSIGGSGILFFPNLTLNNPAGLTLANAITITDSLVMSKGILYSNSLNPVHFSNAAKSPVETNNSYIIGRAIMDERTIGSNPLDQFLGAGLTAGSDLGSVTIIRNTGIDEAIKADGRSSIAANWTINATTPAVTGRTLRLSWLSTLDNNVFVPAVNLYASSNAGYIKQGATSTDVSGSDPRMFSYSNIDLLNRNYTLLDTGFRMKFISFTGSRKPAGVDLQWLTGTEYRNKGFDIERSIDGVTFTKVGFETGKNNLTSNSYNYVDATVQGLTNKLVYYRLKQVSEDGTEQYSETIVMMLNGLFHFNVYPNPFIDHVTLDIVKEDSDPVQLRLITVSGATVYRQTYNVTTTGKIELKGLNNLAAGVYYLNIANKHFYETIKLIKYHN